MPTDTDYEALSGLGHIVNVIVSAAIAVALLGVALHIYTAWRRARR